MRGPVHPVFDPWSERGALAEFPAASQLEPAHRRVGPAGDGEADRECPTVELEDDELRGGHPRQPHDLAADGLGRVLGRVQASEAAERIAR